MIRLGDRVKLNSGGPPMTVIKIRPPYEGPHNKWFLVECEWHAKKRHTDWFYSVCLTKA